jgi:hypothetical protein
MMQLPDAILVDSAILKKKRWLLDYGENLKFGGEKKKESSSGQCHPDVHTCIQSPIICRAVFQIGFISKMNFVRGLRIFGLAAMSLLP